ncbi:MAG: hypothetical protein ACYTGN_02495 [Planctomycetota bacterium]|jgi:hypothetical protein
MRRVVLSLAILVAAVAGVVLVTKRGPEPIELLSINRMPQGTRHVDFGDFTVAASALKRKLMFRSNVDHKAAVRVKLEDAQPAGMAAELGDNGELLPRATREISLTIHLKGALGPVSGRLVLYSDEVPGWSYAVTFKGTAIKEELKGKRIGVHPPYVALGFCKPGEKRPFVVTVSNHGSEPLTIREWRYDTSRVELRELAGGEIVPPGGKLQVGGTASVPDTQGQWSTDLDILSDDDFKKLKRLRIAGVVKPEFTLDQPRVRLGNVFPPRQDRFKLTVSAAEGVAPFKVVRIENLATHFEVVSLGGDAPAAKQTVELRVSKSAPHGALAAYPLRLIVEPPGREITVRVDAWMRPSVYAQPGRINFGKVKPGAVVRPRGVHVLSFAGTTVQVKKAAMRHGYFVVKVKQSAGIVPTITVSPTPGLAPNLYRDVLLVETDSTDTPRIEIEVIVELQG